MKFKELITINQPIPLNFLTKEQLKELQIALSQLGYPVGEIDGLFGPKTRNAWAEFKADVFYGKPDFIGTQSILALQEKVLSISEERTHNFATKEGTIAAIKMECHIQEIRLSTQIAYILATVEWETAKTFRPVREAFWLSEEWRQNNLRYYPYYGRGFVQLTWETNYRRYAELLRIDLLNNPDLCLDQNVALFILAEVPTTIRIDTVEIID